MNARTRLGELKPVPKVASQTTQGTVTGLITYLIVTAYGKQLPPDVAAALPALIGIAWGFAAGWLKRENIGVPPPPLPPNVTELPVGKFEDTRIVS